MKICTHKQACLLAFLCAIFMSVSAPAQTYVRYINEADLYSKAVYSDSVLTSITLPKGVARLSNYPKFNVAALELAQVLRDPDKELLQVWICGSASPDGLWADNVRLSQARTDEAVAYLKNIMDIPDSKIHKESLNEDWDRLYEMIQASDIPYKNDALAIIRYMDWGQRKSALEKLGGGVVWNILQKDFFPQLRCVRFAIYCKWDPSKPYMTSLPVNHDKPQVKIPESKVDTVFIRDTVYYVREKVVIQTEEPVAPEEAYETYRQKNLNRNKKVWDTPWRMGFKTNLLSDAIAIPSVGLELQLGSRVSLDLQGYNTNYNIFCPEDQHALVYGIAPELRLWLSDRTMEQGSFVGIHARCLWYTLQWRDGYLYQNGRMDMYDSDAGNSSPAWSAGLTYGYSLGLGRRDNWGIEFVLGVGYGHYMQNRGSLNPESGTWIIYDFQDKHHFGITHVGINLTYRFSLRRVDPDYYNN